MLCDIHGEVEAHLEGGSLTVKGAEGARLHVPELDVLYLMGMRESDVHAVRVRSALYVEGAIGCTFYLRAH